MERERKNVHGKTNNFTPSYCRRFGRVASFWPVCQYPDADGKGTTVNERWIRLNATFDESQWLVNLPPLPRLIWPVILAYVKTHGAKGVCKAPNLARWCAGKDLPLEAVLELLDAAVADDAMRLDDNAWCIVNWGVYQQDDSTGYERLKRHRKKRQQAAIQVQNDNGMITDDNALSSGDNGMITPDNAPDIDIDIDKDNPPLSPKGKRKPSSSSDDSESSPVGWELFIAAYPKRPGRNQSAAKPIYERIIRKVDPEDVIEGAKSYADYCLREKKDPQYIKMMPTWLNQKGWQDDYGEVRKKSEFDDLPGTDVAHLQWLVS